MTSVLRLRRSGSGRAGRIGSRRRSSPIARLLRKTRAHEIRSVWANVQANLGNALLALGERESGTARLEEAIAAFRAALEEATRQRVPLDWASTENNLGNALSAFGERESGTARLEEAVVAYRAALEERTRERVPLQWAMTENNLGIALKQLGERESGTARLDEAVAAYRAALEERTRERVPLDWAQTQSNLGNALRTLGERESGTARLEEAVAACRGALEELPVSGIRSAGRRPRTVWATRSGRWRAGEWDGAARGGVAAFRAALEERTRERVPLSWARSFGNQGVALMLIADRANDAAMAETAVQQIETAYETERSGGQRARGGRVRGAITQVAGDPRPAQEQVRARRLGQDRHREDRV